LSPRIRITHLKLFADGALGSRGAALTHPYADDPATTGVARMTPDQIVGLALRAIDRDLGVATHAIGDEAVGRALDAYQRVLAERPDLTPGRLRIEHFSYAREADFARAVRLGILLSIQSNFNAAPSDQQTLGALRVGAANEDRVYAWDRLFRLGASVAEGSDYFGLPGEPLAGFAASLTRRHAVGEGQPDDAGRRLAYRMNAALVGPNGTERAGAIRVGEPADLVILSGNPLTLPRSELAAVRVIGTIGAGRLTYSSSRESR
jgi:predicted amidohydrolase YtcJ